MGQEDANIQVNPESKVLPVGTLVLIRPDSQFSCQNFHGVGTIMNLCKGNPQPGDFCYIVHFDDGHSDGYRRSDVSPYNCTPLCKCNAVWYEDRGNIDGIKDSGYVCPNCAKEFVWAETKDAATRMTTQRRLNPDDKVVTLPDGRRYKLYCACNSDKHMFDPYERINVGWDGFYEDIMCELCNTCKFTIRSAQAIRKQYRYENMHAHVLYCNCNSDIKMFYDNVGGIFMFHDILETGIFCPDCGLFHWQITTEHGRGKQHLWEAMNGSL